MSVGAKSCVMVMCRPSFCVLSFRDPVLHICVRGSVGCLCHVNDSHIAHSMTKNRVP